MVATEITASWTTIALAVASTAAVLATVITYTRLAGLRSFSKMSSFDFAVTVAVGTVMGSIALSGSSLAVGVAVLAAFYLLQAGIALLRRTTRFDEVVDNDPLVLMVGPDLIEANLARTRVTAADVHSKLREANVYNYDQLKAVVLESTGDISVIHGDGPLDLDIFGDVIEHQRLQPLTDEPTAT